MMKPVKSTASKSLNDVIHIRARVFFNIHRDSGFVTNQLAALEMAFTRMRE